MTSNPAGTTHAAIVDQLIEEALSYEESVQPGLGECLREAARPHWARSAGHGSYPVIVYHREGGGMMATEKKTARQKKLDRIIANIGRFALSETYPDEGVAQRRLLNAIEELKAASKMLIETES